MKLMPPMLAIATALLAAAPLAAQDSRPSEASVRRVLAASHRDTVLDAYTAQVEDNMRSAMQHELAGQPLNAQQRAIMDHMQDQLVALMREEMDWKRMEPQVIALYRNTFTQQEVNAMLAWYTSAAGKAVLAKEHLLTQQMADYAQARVQDLVPKLMHLQKETIVQLRAAASPPEGAAAPPAPPGQP
ncbi:MAG: DUF2059 domain-containing protein [Proteobacteria bacterium]|nr:DUF2059 domain-containing protein [Pseudomonadota bacterium]